MGAPVDASQLYTERADAYLRFVHCMGYPRGLRSVFMKSPALRPGLRILDAGCGSGTTTFALRSAAEARGVPIGAIDAFDLTPAMLERFRRALDQSRIEGVRLEEADVLRLDTLRVAQSEPPQFIDAWLANFRWYTTSVTGGAYAR